MTMLSDSFKSRFFYNEINRFSGSGGEFVLRNQDLLLHDPKRIEVGDILIGIGITHIVEAMDRPPGTASFYSLGAAPLGPAKMAMRAFRVAEKEPRNGGFGFNFSYLSPAEYSDAVNVASQGLVVLSPETISEGTVILSFLDSQPTYSLASTEGSPGVNWLELTKGERHWNVGMRDPADFWEAWFPADDVGLLSSLPPWERVGDIRFGLSLLNPELDGLELERLPATRIDGRQSSHHFCLRGAATGVKGINSAFPIGLRTEIIFKPIR